MTNLRLVSTVAAVSVILGLIHTAAASHMVTISNVSPRYTTDGQIMPAHDGNMLLVNVNGSSQYLFYGMSYGACREPTGDGCSHQGGDPNCGFNTNHTVLLYSSPDLSNGSWRLVANAFPDTPDRPEAIYYRPKVRYNPLTKLYVMWINAVPASDFSKSFYVVATSPTPQGPFKVARQNAPVLQSGPGDFDIFPDNNGTAYIIYTSINNGHAMSIERLTPDWLNSTMQNSGFFGQTFVEAPAMFRRGDVYYAIFGHCCCFCAAGSGAVVYTATSVFGPYTEQNNIGCTVPTAPSCPANDSVPRAQQNQVNIVPDGQGNPQYLWTGDRWQSAPDGIKDHDFQYWTVMQFNDSEPIPSIAPFQYESTFTIVVG